MSRIKGIRSSAALMVAVVALVAALGGGAVAGVTISKLKPEERNQVKRIAKRQAKQLDKRIELQPGPQGPEGPPGPSTGSAGGDLTGNYPNPAIANSAVNAAKVEDDSIGGADVDESSLGLVPDADALDGMDSSDFAPANMVHSSAATVQDNPGDIFQTTEVLVQTSLFQVRGDCQNNLNGSGSDSATVRLFGPVGHSVAFTDTGGGVGNNPSEAIGTALASASDPGGGSNLIEGAHFIAVARPSTGDRTLAGHVSAEVNNDGGDCTFAVNLIGG